MKKMFSLLTVLAMVLPSFAAAAELPEGFTKVKEAGGITEYQLASNGLTVLLKEDHSAPVLTFMVTYRVGSRNEVTGTTGATHLLEHLMFKGTDKFNKADGTSIDQTLMDKGARLNASTWKDRTNYYENLPSEHLKLAAEIEADRMRNLWLREEDRRPEMTVVRNEFERGENSPYGSLDKAIWASAFQAHPYHHSTIGWKSDIEHVPIEKLRAFYDTYYWPNNATVTVIGDFQTNEALNVIKEYFGKIPHSQHKIPEVYTREPEQLGPRRVEVERAGQLGVVGIAHKVPEGTHEDTYALSVLNKILTDGKTSRLYRKLIDQGKATNIFTFYFPLRNPGLFIPYIFLAPGATHQEVEQAVLEEYDNIKENGVSQEEVDRAVNQIVAETAYSRDGSFSMASELNEAIAMGDWTFYVHFPEKVKEVTPADVQRVVKTYMKPEQSTTGYFIPRKPGGQEAVNTSAPQRQAPKTMYYYRDPDGPFRTGDSPSASSKASGTAAQTNIADKIQENDIHGIHVYSMKTGVDNVVTIRGSLPAGDVQSPAGNSMIADLTGSMLDKGTTAHDKLELASKLENMGASINFNVDSNNLSFSARCLRKDAPEVIALLAEQLRDPAFSPEELDKVKKQKEGSLKRNLDDTNYMAASELSRQLFPKGHPNYRPTVDEMLSDLDKVTVEDLKAFHKKHYGPQNMILVAVGDLEDHAIEQAVSTSFEGWSGGSSYRDYDRAPSSTASDKLVYMEDKTSVTLMAGTPTGLKETDADYLPLYLGNYILGGNFSARLMSIVRDDEGLTYGINSMLGGDTYSDGYWGVQATFAPNLLDKGVASTMREIKRWVQDGVTQKELEAKKTTIAGSYKVRMATTRGMASLILSTAQIGRPMSYLDEYVPKVQQVSLEQVNDAIRKYVDPSRLVTVKAGTVEEGKTN